MGVKLGQKWAVKDGNLLASNQVGSRFFNKEFDFSRASNGTYVDRDGLLKTAELYNLLEYSQDFDQWTLTNITREDNQIGYDGSNKAYKIIANGTNNDKIRYNLTQISQQTFSAYVKKGNVNFTVLEYQGFAYFDLENGLVGTTTGIESASIQDAGNGWYRCSITVTTTANRTAQIYIAAANGSTSTSLGDYIYIQDAQVVEGTEPLDYQYTNGLQGLPRISFEDGVGHLLLEPQRSNLITYSEDWTQSVWVKRGFEVNSTTEQGPLGTSKAIKITENNTNINPALIFSLDVTDGTDRTFSVWGKASENIDIALATTGSLRDGTISLTTDWQKFEITSNYNSTSTPHIGGFSTIPRGCGITFYFAMPQVEAGSYSTSYIKSDSGTTTTRLADVCNNSGSAQDFNSEEGVLYAEVSALSDDLSTRYISLSDGSVSNEIYIRYDTVSNRIVGTVTVGGGAAASFITTDYNIINFNKIAIKYKENDFALWVNGVKIGADISGSVFSLNTLDTLNFIRGNSTLPFYGKVRNLQAFTEALGDTELMTLTGGDSSSDGLLASYISRVEADGGTVEAQACVKNELIELL